MSKSANSRVRQSRGRMTVCVSMIVIAGTVLAACRDTNPYLSRRDTIRLGAGDAAAHNRAVHTIDPWPVRSKNTDIAVDGKRMMVGIERYQRNESLEPESGDTTERFKKDKPPEGPPAGDPS